MNQRESWRGLVALVGQTVEAGSRAIEQLQKEVVRRPFEVLEEIPPIGGIAGTVHKVIDLCATVTHGAIRGVTRVVTASVDAALTAVPDKEKREP